MTAAIVGFTVVAVAALVTAEVREQRLAKLVSKPLASLGFILLGFAGGLHSGSPAQVAVFVGLVFGAMGDLCLLSRDKRWFLAGLVSFLVNHVAFVVAFLLWGVQPLWAVAGAVPLGLVALGVWRRLGPRAGRLARPVAAYIIVITAMVACAVGAFPTTGPVLLVAATLFFVSDLAVARDRFVAPGWQNKVWGLPTYYAAQLLFAWGAGHPM